MSWPEIVYVAGWPAVFAGICTVVLRRRTAFGRYWYWGGIGLTSSGVVQVIALPWLHQPLRASLYLGGGVVHMVIGWWLWHRKRRDPAARTLGAKAKASRDALVRKAREAAQPRPVLRPVPQAR